MSSRTSPVSDSPITAVRWATALSWAQRSTQFQVMFTRPSVNQVAHGTPFEVSSTFEYGVVKSSPRSFTTASQYHSTSSTERRRISSIVSIPCARIRRVTFACST